MQLGIQQRGLAALALLLAFHATSCAQLKNSVARPSLADRVATRLAQDELVETIFEQAKLEHPALQIGDPVDEPLDLKIARFLIQGRGDDSDLDSLVGLLELATQYSVSVIQGLTEDDKFLDAALSVASMKVDSHNRLGTDAEEQFELRMLGLITPEKAALLRRTAEKLPSLRSKETIAVRERLRAGFVQAISRHTERLKPFTEEKPPSQALQAARGRVRKLESAMPSR